MATPVEVAWAAGVFDGEGCITITFQKPGTYRRINNAYRLYIKVTMGHKPTIEKLHTLFELGAITTQRSNKGHNDAWTWWVASRQAIEVLQKMRPFLVTKAEEADLAFEWGQLPLVPRGGKGGGQAIPPAILAERHRLFEAMRDIKPSSRFRAAKNAALLEA
jgi:hypothetical protein